MRTEFMTGVNNRILQKLFQKQDLENQHIELKIFGLKIKYRPKRKSVFYIGKNNVIKITKEDGSTICNPDYVEGMTIIFSGDNSLVQLSEPHRFNNCKIRIGTNNTVRIGKSRQLINDAEFLIFRKKNNGVFIGEDFSSESIVFDLGDEPNLSIFIGKNCMASHAIILRPSDGHSIKNSNGEIINYGEDIIIGEHVWIGFDVYLLKGSKVPNNSVIGARSTYTRNSYKGENIGCGAIFAGNPAKIVKTNITWSREKASQNIRRNSG